jgi:polyphosphate kinase
MRPGGSGGIGSRPRWRPEGIRVLDYDELPVDARITLQTYFETSVFPVLTPLAVDPSRPFPHISNLSLNLAVVVRDVAGAGANSPG